MGDVSERWNRPGVPHKGWIDDHVTELKEPDGKCEMCAKSDIRYLHTIFHTDYGSLEVGCVCAEKMCVDPKQPKYMEQALKNKLKRECTKRRRDEDKKMEMEEKERQRAKSWKDLRSWRTTQKGGYSRKIEAGYINIFNKNSKWKHVLNGEFSAGFEKLDEAIQDTFEKYFE